MIELYNTDVLRAAGDPAAPSRRWNKQVDWENLIDEVESVGRSQLHAVVSYLIQAFLHDLKAEAWPLSRDVEHWRAEARMQRDQVPDHYTASTAQRIDVDKIYRQARRGLPATIDGTQPLPVPDACPVTLAELLSEPED